MRIWLVTVGEPLPTDGEGERLLRAGILCSLMREAGHEVTWWTSTFDHMRKRHRAAASERRILPNGAVLWLLRGCGYRRNISLRRIADHWLVAREFRRLAPGEVRPDIVLCSVPTLELALESTRYGRCEGVPVVLDVRDLWPDIMIERVPAPLRGLASSLLLPMWRQARTACRNATAIAASSPPFVARGLALAGRAAGPFDRDFPFGYVRSDPVCGHAQAAREYWRGLGISGDTLNVCFAGTMGDQVDLDTVLDAARLLEERELPVRVVLCGTGPRYDHLRRRAEGMGNVCLPGWIGAPEIAALMQLSVAGLAPYRNNAGFADNYPNKTIEYMSAGLLVISSLEGRFKALVTERACGLHYNSDAPHELAAAIERLCREPKMREGLARNARELYEEQFDGRKVYGAMIDYLIDVAGRGVR